MHLLTLEILLVVFIASLVRSVFGFGEALIAVPLLALILPIQIAVPLAVLLSVAIAAVVLVQDWRKIHLGSTAWLLVSTLAGIPAGIWLLRFAHQDLLKAALAAVILLFSGYSLLGRRSLRLEHDSRPWLLGCGFLAGVLGGAYGMNGPPLVIYGAMRRWSPQHFRATLQAYFLPASAIAIAGYALSGLWTKPVTHYFLVSLIAAIPATFLGGLINRRLRGDAFLRYVYIGLICIGIVLLVQAVGHHV
ncbi:MAG TPA: sulfite exporter TauE/SafE family protein [Acidobacteriaceae bacterium]|nr:sulfite exporter TauE/SafE family protein [Acidobacteriaceae bacterium]